MQSFPIVGGVMAKAENTHSSFIMNLKSILVNLPQTPEGAVNLLFLLA